MNLSKKTLYKYTLVSVFSLFLVAVTFFHNLSYQPWIYLSVLASSLSIFILFKKNIKIPSKNLSFIFLGLFLVLIIVDVMNGSHLSEERWLMRYTVCILVFLCMQIFDDDKSIYAIVGLPLTLFLLFITVESISEYILFFDPLNSKLHSVHVSRFWNIAHYCQAMVASIPFIILFKKYSNPKLSILYDFLILTLTTSILLGLSRSCSIALFIIYFIEFKSPLVYTKKRLITLLAISFLIFYCLNEYKNGYESNIQQQKKQSLNYRKTLWQKSIEMALDNPAGIGVNNFGFGLFAYLDDQKLSDRITDINFSPHSEPLRVLTEEGWGIFIIYLICLIAIITIGIIKIFITKESAIFYRFALCMLPELLFQFPTEMYMPCFLFALICATSFEKKIIAGQNSKKTILTLALITSLLTSFSWIVRNEKIIPLDYSKQLCSVYQDSWRICRRYFFDYLSINKPQEASDVIRPILKYQPYNFYVLTLDHTLGDPERNQFLSCLYYNLFNGKLSINSDDPSICILEKNRSKLRSLFKEYSENR